jgi:hypothetical protein
MIIALHRQHKMFKYLFNFKSQSLQRKYILMKNLTLAAMPMTVMITGVASGVIPSESRPGKPPLMPLQLTHFSSSLHPAKDTRNVKFQCRPCDFGNEILPHLHSVNFNYFFAFEFAPKILSSHVESIFTYCFC